MEPKTGFNFKLIWGLFMVIIYLGMAVALIFTDIFNLGGNTLRIIIGVLFLLYAIFRGISVIKYGK